MLGNQAALSMPCYFQSNGHETLATNRKIIRYTNYVITVMRKHLQMLPCPLLALHAMSRTDTSHSYSSITIWESWQEGLNSANAHSRYEWPLGSNGT